MISLSMHHFPKTKKVYSSLNKASAKQGECTFCTSAKSEPNITENDTMYVVANRVAYDLFEGYRVAKHLMIIPKQHRVSIAEFTPQEAQDYISIAGQFEAKGYSVYARGADSPTRSVTHQHTHLIKLKGTAPKAIIYTAKPHILVAK